MPGEEIAVGFAVEELKRRREERQRRIEEQKRKREQRKIGGQLRSASQDKQNTGITFFFFIAFIIHLVDVFFRLSGGSFSYYNNIYWLYFALGIWAGIGPFKNESKSIITNILSYLGLTTLAYLIPLANLIIRDLGFTGTIGQNLLEGLILFAPLWLIYLMYVKGSAFTQKIGVVYAIFWLVLFIMSYTQEIKQATTDVQINGFNPGRIFQYVVEQFWSGTKFVVGSTVDLIKSIPNSIGKWWQGTICYATARSDCEGDVDPTTNRIGVFLQDIQSDTSFFWGRTIRIPFLLRARSLSSAVNIKLSCKATNVGFPQGIKGDVLPRNSFSIDNSADELEKQVDCVFKSDSANLQLDEGSHDAIIAARFNFQTQARLVQYFIDDALLSSLRIKKQDPLVVYRDFIEESSPVATYSNGPIKIGMGLGELKMPIGIDTEEENYPGTINVNILNNWNGKVKNFSSIYIIIPKGFEVKEIDSEEFGQEFQVNCDGDIKQLSLCDDDVEQVIFIPKSHIDKYRKGSEMSIAIDYLIPQLEYSRVLEKGVPVTTKYFKVFVDYDYELEHKKGFRVIESPAEK